MDPWNVIQGDNRFTVDGLPKLVELARSGKLSPGDMVQPPGADDWVYASEVSALADHFRDDDSDEKPIADSMSFVLPALLVAGLLAVIAVGGVGVLMLLQYLPDGDEVLIGEGGMTYSEMIVTADGANLADTPDPKGRPVVGVPKDSAIELLARRGEFYRARTKDGAEGWIPVTDVLPMYQLGGKDVLEQFDPLYNPAHYVDVLAASWLQLPDQENKDSTVTVFEVTFGNNSLYDMTDLKIQVAIKDAKGVQLELREIAVEGIIPKKGVTGVGTMKPDPKLDPEGPSRLLTEVTWEEMKTVDPTISERWMPGLELTLAVPDFDNAKLDIVELRAIP